MPKTVLITGTSSGIGKVAALYFSQQGWQVAATMRTPEKDIEVKSYTNTKVYALDVTNSESISAAFTSVINDFGKIDVVVNNAGYGVDGVFEAMTDETIERQFDTNVFGLMRVTRTAIAYMRENGGGTIIQIASMGGRLAFPLYSIYHGTKWAVEGFTESLQFEVKHLNIKLKLVEPGAIKTEFYGTSREFVKPTHTQTYDNFVKKAEQVTTDAASTAPGPEVVAKTIFKAATDTSSKLRYPVGGQGPLLLRIRKMLPDWLWFGIVKTVYKL
jgi:NAD(P)-dependent dehydrogenase (short-subunit alcohol dehydrogenase family)